jgi:hypothetical protein
MYCEINGRGSPGSSAGADFTGWGDGGRVALMLAVRRFELVRRLRVWGASGVPGAGATPAA